MTGSRHHYGRVTSVPTSGARNDIRKFHLVEEAEVRPENFIGATNALFCES
jgi:hypothetical protein